MPQTILNMKELLLKLCRREDLTREEARASFEAIMSGDAAEAQIGGLLVGLAAKGSTVEELVGAAQVMREKVVPIEIPPAMQPVLDTCGTGGDVRGTFNISTAAALIAAAAGARIVKHGNRSASGKSGSADVLEHLGVKLDLTSKLQQHCLQVANICFAFARAHHPAMKHVAAARTALGIPTIFNLLGPLTNPGQALHQLMGVFAPELTDRLAAVLRELGSRRAWVVHAEDGLDEISTLGPTRISELRNGHVKTWTLDPKSLGLEYARLSDLQCKDVKESAGIVAGILAGERSPARDIAVLNAAAGLVIVEKFADLPSALAAANKVLDSGAAQKTLDALAEASHAEPGPH
jgi:anthranilate phosphoribosyltransferase